MHAPRLTALVVSTIVTLAATTRGQVLVAPAPAPPPGGTTTITVSKEVRTSGDMIALPPGVTAAHPGAAPVSDANAKKAARLQKIQQLTFDRRPSAILQAWSTPDGPAPAEPRAGIITPPVLPGQPTPPAPDAFDAELKVLQRHVTLGDWTAVRADLARLAKDEAKAAYKRLIQALPNPPGHMMPGMVMNAAMMRGMPMLPQFLEKNVFNHQDVIALAATSPTDLDDELIAGLAQVLRMALERGHAVEDFVARVRAEARGPFQSALTPRQAAKLLVGADRAVEAGQFLPTPDEAEKSNDREALNLLSRHYLALHAKEKKTAHLEQAWKVNQAVLAVGQVDREEKDEALKRAVELAPKVRDELGQTWLGQSFTSRPERGKEILAAIGSAVAKGLQTQPTDPNSRRKALELQRTAVESLLAAAPGQAAEWRPSLTILAAAWLTEAQFSHQFDQSTSFGPRMRRDSWGNIFYVNPYEMQQQEMIMRQQNMPRPIPVPEVLETMPGDAWLALVDEAMKPKFATVFAQLFLKVAEEARAFPHIERLAATHPDQAHALADEFLRVWVQNHDPNAERNRTNPYMFMFGFERRAEGIPLTRSKQERNLKELAGWVARLRKLPIGRVDEQLLAKAFTTSHSTAEVYRLEAIESVFGSFDALKPETLAELVQQMRGNLAGLWRQPAEQEKAKTKRKEKDIKAEVMRGYQVARAVAERGLERHPDHWALELAKASVLHDENGYRQEIEPSTAFTANRLDALARFRRAAQLYVAKAPTLAEEDESIRPFELWFYAGLGAVDLQQIDEQTQPDLRQPALIREAILSLPTESAERHMSKFANSLFTRMSAANPAVKHRYLRGGFAIVGDHKQAREARKVFDYYDDLVTEIKLDAVVDGPGEIGHGRPFGVFVNLRHTREIERESGGFGRYLQNQNTGNVFYYNYGRPLQNYRDKFQETVKKAAEEHFEVLSVTFQDEKAHSRATAEYGWRVTPYAYVLLKAREAKVDKVPPFRLDLDFLDTSGYVVLPVESPAVPVDASPAEPPPRPFAKLQLTQTLDERQAQDGKLVLEVKAVARGLVPELDQLLDVRSEGFEVVNTEDQGLSVARFDPDSPETAVVSERGWLVSLRAADGLPRPPAQFHFAAAKVDDAEMTYQRYVDADLAKVDPVVSLEERYGRPSRAWVWWTLVGVVAALAVVLAWWLWPREARVETGRFAMPDPVTPFTVLGLLRDIQQNDGLSEASHRELAASIAGLEQHFFSRPAAEEPDLRRVAETWLGRTS